MHIPPVYDEKLRQLMRAFLAENENINLSALRTEEACWIGNIEDSLALLELSDLVTRNSPARAGTDGKLLDIGTGGGFPLLPLAICLPDMHLTGLDSIKKKIDAIARIAKNCDIHNLSVIADRAETLGHDKKHREQYDIVTARAVAPINILLEYCSPFVKQNGKIVLWKSLHVADELKASEAAQRQLHCAFTKAHEYALDGDFGSRQLLIFTKTKQLSADFPREVGMAKRAPL